MFWRQAMLIERESKEDPSEGSSFGENIDEVGNTEEEHKNVEDDSDGARISWANRCFEAGCKHQSNETWFHVDRRFAVCTR